MRLCDLDIDCMPGLGSQRASTDMLHCALQFVACVAEGALTPSLRLQAAERSE